MKKIKTAYLLWFCSFLSGCSGSLLLIDKNNKQSIGSFNSANKTLEVKVDGVDYKGFYVTNDSATVGMMQGFSGTKSAFGTGQAYSTGYTGRAILKDSSGNVIQCEFNYSGMKAIGNCTDNKGQTYHLIAD
jgi:hypothetical protein